MRSKSNPTSNRLAGGLARAALWRGFLLLFATSTFANPIDCAFLGPLQSVKAQKPASFAKIRDFNAYMDLYKAAQEQSAREFYQAYRSEQASGSTLETCIPAPSERQDFDQLLPRIFLESSLAELSAGGKGPETRRFLGIIRQRQASGQLNAFRLIAHHDESNPTGLPGGFHRANRSIFMDLGKIPGHQWLVVLTHELAHAVDIDLARSLAVYNNDQTVARIAEWGHRTQSAGELKPDELAVLDAWLIAGLNRGLLTETRAWAMTLAVYREGLGTGRFEPISWAEALFASVQEVQEIKDPSHVIRSVLAILSPRFPDPRDGIFSLAIVRDRLAEIRAKLSSGELPLDGIR